MDVLSGCLVLLSALILSILVWKYLTWMARRDEEMYRRLENE